MCESCRIEGEGDSNWITVGNLIGKDGIKKKLYIFDAGTTKARRKCSPFLFHEISRIRPKGKKKKEKFVEKTPPKIADLYS